MPSSTSLHLPGSQVYTPGDGPRRGRPGNPEGLIFLAESPYLPAGGECSGEAQMCGSPHSADFRTIVFRFYVGKLTGGRIRRDDRQDRYKWRIYREEWPGKGVFSKTNSLNDLDRAVAVPVGGCQREKLPWRPAVRDSGDGSWPASTGARA